MADPGPAAACLDAVLRQDRGRCLAALVARIGDFPRAEEALQEAAASALVHWARLGPPAHPQAWLIRAGLRKAIDAYRREAALARHRAAIGRLALEEAALDAEPDRAGLIPDDRLRLIFTCCHPALEQKTRVALTLRSLCGLTTAQVAAVFLDAETTMGQRLSRARAKIAAAGIPFAVPGPEDWPARLNSVLTVIYLVFTAGYAAGPAAGRDLCDEAVFLARMLRALRPGDAEIDACLALLLLTQARRAARTAPDGATVPPQLQDRTLWDAALIAEAQALLAPPAPEAPFRLKAGIAACHLAQPPDWARMAALQARLLAFEDTPVTRLSHAVALGEAEGAEAALAALAPLAADLRAYQPFHAAAAEFLARAGEIAAARAAYAQAIALAASPADAAFLRARASVLSDDSQPRKKEGRAEARPKSNREV